jgi:hypothetical protein
MLRVLVRVGIEFSCFHALTVAFSEYCCSSFFFFITILGKIPSTSLCYNRRGTSCYLSKDSRSCFFLIILKSEATHSYYCSVMQLDITK